MHEVLLDALGFLLRLCQFFGFGTYYTVLTLLKEEKPKDYRRMGGELEETVTEILARVEAKRAALG